MYINTVYTKGFKGYCLLPQLKVSMRNDATNVHILKYNNISIHIKGGLLYWFYQRFSLNEPMFAFSEL